MSTELIVPTLGESITEATVSKWLKKIGESFEADEPLVEIETDKITVEVPAPSAGVLSEIKVKEGKDVNIGGVLGIIGESDEMIPSKEKKPLQTEVVKEEKRQRIARRNFTRTYVNYDDNLDLTQAKASFENGLLSVRVPQRPEVQPLSIEIK